jgi:hypothetical protein
MTPQEYRALVNRLEAIQEAEAPAPTPMGGLPSGETPDMPGQAQYKKRNQWDPLVKHGQAILKDPKLSNNQRIGSMYGYLKMIQQIGVHEKQIDQWLATQSPLVTKNKEAWKAANAQAQYVKPATDAMRINYADGFMGPNGLGDDLGKDLVAQYGQWLASSPALEEPKPFSINPFK